MNFKKFQRGIITLEIRVKNPEKFLNLLWKNNIVIKNISKENITTLIMKIKLSDYKEIEKIAQRTNTKIKIIKREGISFFVIKLKKRMAFTVGIFIFVLLLYYFSTYVWNINIISDKYTAPFEIRQQLKNIGVKPGIYKKNLNLNEIKDIILNNNDDIMWINLIVEGSSLKVRYVERKTPPDISRDDSPCNIIAAKDAVVERVFTSSGTAVVKPGDIVKKGQLLIKGEQGSEGNIYQVPARGEIIGKTFYEETEDVSAVGIKKTRTWKKTTNWFVQFKDKKFYLKKSLNKYKNYDKIIGNLFLIKKEDIYEVVETIVDLDIKSLVQDTSERLYLKIVNSIEKTNKIEDKKVEFNINKDTVSVRVSVQAEESIGLIQR